MIVPVAQLNKPKGTQRFVVNMTFYKITPVQAKWLQKFQWQNLKSSYGQGLLTDMSEKGMFVFPTHQQVWDHNKIDRIFEIFPNKNTVKSCWQLVRRAINR
jgi:hypothetical protein